MSNIIIFSKNRTVSEDCESVQTKIEDQMFIWYSEENCGEIVDGSPNGQKCLYRVSLPFALRGAILNVRGYPQSRQTRGRLRDYDFQKI